MPQVPDIAQFGLNRGFSGSPALTDYWMVVWYHWPNLSVHAGRQLANVGTIVRCATAVDRQAGSLVCEWIEAPMNNMRIYESELAEFVRKFGLTSNVSTAIKDALDVGGLNSTIRNNSADD